MEKTADHAAWKWGVLALGIVALEFCPGETLSTAFRHGLESRYRTLVVGAMGLTAVHLFNGFEKLGLERGDPFYIVASFADRALPNFVNLKNERPHHGDARES